MASKREQGEENFKKGYNCSQAVVMTFADELGLDQDTILRMAASFGGGMGRMREVCGAASGMFMIAGLINGSADPKDREAKKANYDLVQRMAEMYREKNERHSIVCRELLGLDTDHPSVSSGAVEGTAPEKRTEQYYKKRPCACLVGDACEIVETILNERKQ